MNFISLTEEAISLIRTQIRRDHSAWVRTLLPSTIYDLFWQSPLFFENFLNAVWWQGMYPVFIGEPPPLSEFSEDHIELFAFLSHQKNPVIEIYARHEYFGRQQRLMTIARHVNRHIDQSVESVFVQFRDKGWWMSCDGKIFNESLPPDDWQISSIISFDEVSLKVASPNMIHLPPNIITDAIRESVENAVFYLPDEVRLKTDSGLICNQAATESNRKEAGWVGFSTEAGESMVPASGIRRVVKLDGATDIETIYKLNHLEEFGGRYIQSLKFKYLKNIGKMLIHELNNPVSGIYNLSQLMQLNLDPEEGELHEVLKNVELQCEIVREMLSYFAHYFASDSVGNELVLEEVELKPFFGQVKILVQAALSKVQFDYDVVPAGLILKTCRLKLLHVLVNLVINASEALSERKDGVIMVSATKKLDGLSIEVMDNGPGLSPGIRADMFKPFFSTKCKTGPNRGLGLAIVKMFLDELGYELKVESEPNRGTSFEILVRSSE